MASIDSISGFCYKIMGFDLGSRQKDPFVVEPSSKPFLVEGFDNGFSVKDFAYLNEKFPFIISYPNKDTIEGINLQLESAELGPKGPNSIADRVRAETEWSISNCSYFSATLLPDQYIFREDNKRFVRKIRLIADEAIRLSVDRSVWGTETGLQFILWCTNIECPTYDPITEYVRNLDELYGVWGKFKNSSWVKSLDWVWSKAKGCQISDFKSWQKENKEKPSQINKVNLPEENKTPSSKITLNGHSTSLNVSCKNDLSFLKYKLSKNRSGYKKYLVNDKRISIFDKLSREDKIARNPDYLDNLFDVLSSFDLDVSVDGQVYDWLDNKQNDLKRHNCYLEQWVNKGDEWSEIKVERGVREEFSELYNQWMGLIEKRIDWNLWGFQKDDLARALIKGDVIYAGEMATGKTRLMFSWIEVLQSKRNLAVLESRLVNEMLSEARKIGFPIEDINIIEDPKDAKIENLERLNVITYSRVWRPVDDRVRNPNDEKEDIPVKTNAHVLRETYFNTIFFDEAHRLKGGNSTKQGRYSKLLRSKHTVSMSGTILDSYPKDIYPILCITFGENKLKNSYGYENYPVIDEDNPERYTSGYKKFKSKYVKRAKITSKFENDLENRSGKEIPEVPEENLEEWYEMFDKKVIRRLCSEPPVNKHLDVPDADRIECSFDISDKHAEFYYWWLSDFYDWFSDNISNGGSINNTQVMVQLNKLRFASTFPQSEKVNIEGEIEWYGGLTEKQKGVLDKVKSFVDSGEQVLVFAESPDFIEFMSSTFTKNSVSNDFIHGGVPINKRVKPKKSFKNGSISTLLISRGCGSTGLNLPEASTVLSVDWCWRSSKMNQAESRILRSEWKDENESFDKPKVIRSIQKGTIDEYMKQLVDAKDQGSSEAVDRQKSNINPEEWLSWRDFSVKMLRDMGFEI